MPRTGPRRRVICQDCGQACRVSTREILEYICAKGVCWWQWHQIVRCPPCMAALEHYLHPERRKLHPALQLS